MASAALRNPPLQGLGGQCVVCAHKETHRKSRATKTYHKARLYGPEPMCPEPIIIRSL